MKRRLLIAAIFLLAGAVVNVAVAWGCCFASKLVGHGSRLGFAEVERIADDLRLPSQLRAYESGYKLPRYISWDGSVSIASGFGSRLAYFHIQRHGDPTPRSGGSSRRVQAGWPALALRGYVVIEVDHVGNYLAYERQWMHVVILSIRRPGVHLPLRPNWPGFAVDTLFYAVILWLLIPGPFVLRRFIRVKRGLCPACAYPVGESAVCSECGKTMPERAEAVT